jgi:hypothetical protein
MIDGDYYGSDGKYLGSDGINDNKVYSVVGIDPSTTSKGMSSNELIALRDKEFHSGSTDPIVQELPINHTEFQKIASVIKHETGTNDTDEALWMSHTANNDAIATNMSLYDKLMSGYSSAPASVKQTSLSTSNNGDDASSARAGLINVLSGGTDPTGGARFWDGSDFIAWGTDKTPYGTNGHAKFRQYNNITISESIYNTYKEATLHKYPGGTINYFHKKFTYQIPASVFTNQTNWSGGIFSYDTGNNKSNGIEATGTKGHSIFWKLND